MLVVAKSPDLFHDGSQREVPRIEPIRRKKRMKKLEEDERSRLLCFGMK